MKSKKSQITVYIIIGVTMLLLLSVAIYLANMWRPTAVSSEYVPIKEYVESCIQQKAEEAMILIGANGGYLKPKEMKLSLKPTEGDGILLTGTEHAVPYWFYMQTPNDCRQCMMESQQPTLEEIKKEIDEYINENLPECTKFGQFIAQDYKFKTGKAKTDTIITEDNMRIIVKYPVTIENNGKTTKLNEFETRVDIPLKKIHELALEITKQEKEQAFLESIALHLIALHTGLDMSKLPPLAAVTHDKTIQFWMKPIAEMNIQQLLLSYIPLLQLDKTKDAKQIIKGDNPFESGFYKAFYLRLLSKQYPLKVNFVYLDWPIYFDITPRSGDMLTGETHVQEFPYSAATAFQTNYYEFYYDISAPVLVEIRADDALKGKGYSFNFALELNIRDNKNFIDWNLGKGTVGPWSHDKATVEFQQAETTTGACTKTGNLWKCQLTGKTYSTEIDCAQACEKTKTSMQKYAPAKKLFDETEQRLSKNITIKVIDAVTKNSVPEASLIYKCGKYASTILGGTDAEGKIQNKMPICINGQLSAEKEGYAKKIIGLTIKPDEEKELTIQLEPEAEVLATIKKYPIQIRNIRELDYSLEPEAKLSTSYADIDSWESFGMSALGGFKDQIVSPVRLNIEWKEKNYKVGRAEKNMKIYDRFCCELPEQLGKNNKAILMIEKIPEDMLEPPYFKTVMLEPGVREELLTLVPGRYKVTGTLIDTDGFTIEPGCQEICVEYDMGIEYYAEEVAKGILAPEAPTTKQKCKKWELLPKEKIDIKPAIRGGVVLDNLTGYWNVTRTELNKGGVEFYFIQTLKPNCTIVQDCVLDVCVDVAETQAAGPYSLKYRKYLEPRFLVK
ncbi:MAG: hypothetical protein QW666_01730 [Candidatus Woesearchaeota archaeon]